MRDRICLLGVFFSSNRMSKGFLAPLAAMTLSTFGINLRADSSKLRGLRTRFRKLTRSSLGWYYRLTESPSGKQKMKLKIT